MEKNDELEILNQTRGKGQRVRYEEKVLERKRTSNTYNKLSPMQQKFVDTYILTKDKKVALKEAGYSDTVYASTLLAKPKVAEVVEEKQKELWDVFKGYAEKALMVQVDMLDNPHVSYKVKLDASNSILDRAGYKPADRKEIVGAIGTVALESKAVNDFAERARQLLHAKGLIDDDAIDAEIIED